jgi:phytoene dehydrogenase-like protein
MIHFLEREWSVHYAMGGTGALVQALVRLIEELGGRFHCQSAVQEILVEGTHASGVRLANGDVIGADHVIDPLHFQNTLNSHMGSAFALEPILTQSALVPAAQSLGRY